MRAIRGLGAIKRSFADHCISRGGPNLVLTRVVIAPNQPPRYVIVTSPIGKDPI